MQCNADERCAWICADVSRRRQADSSERSPRRFGAEHLVLQALLVQLHHLGGERLLEMDCRVTIVESGLYSLSKCRYLSCDRLEQYRSRDEAVSVRQKKENTATAAC